ncbi:prepilin-type N-terminal cleavage/methylation domain-containing protein [Candidatus Saccharibacteria bacterium TM7i]|nr:prepilin-type N-terminal cleavage/methylation domain-containing protein [Candidatus Saccharibacteria bacterium TM7i]
MKRAFTIVELLIVVVIIAILAAIVVVAYRGVTSSAAESSMRSDLKNTADNLLLYQAKNKDLPATMTDSIKVESNGNVLTYVKMTGSTFCLSITGDDSTGRAFHTTEEGDVADGECPAPYIQTITTAGCPVVKTVAVDARNNHTYWVQKLVDGNCWMLTNLAYAGGGSNAYGDVKTIAKGTLGGGVSVTAPQYFIHSNSNPTTTPTKPSVSTDGGVTSPQYGYYYNWCAAMGAQNGTNGQPSTAACAEATTPAPNTNVSICPAGWRLPTGDGAGEFTQLIAALGAGSGVAGVNMLKSIFFIQFGANVTNYGFNVPGTSATLWSSSQYSSTNAYYMSVSASGYIFPAMSGNAKNLGFNVRCIAV